MNNPVNIEVNETLSAQVKTRKRVADHGEVFTAEREVNAMLDLVKSETERIDSRFLEPACGDGNFLAEILRRKLSVVESRYSKSQIEYERYSIIAVSSIYGIDILQDNVNGCRERLFDIFKDKYFKLFVENCKDEYLKSAEFILRRNILWGDAISLNTVDEQKKPIVFSEWSPLNGSMIKRRDFIFKELINHRQSDSLNLFSDLGDQAFIPNPIAEFPLIHFLKIGDVNENEL